MIHKEKYYINGHILKLKKNYKKHRDAVHRLINVYLDTDKVVPDGIQPQRYGNIMRACYYIPAEVSKLGHDICIFAEQVGVTFIQKAHFNKKPKDFGFETEKPESL